MIMPQDDMTLDEKRVLSDLCIGDGVRKNLAIGMTVSSPNTELNRILIKYELTTWLEAPFDMRLTKAGFDWLTLQLL